jgi:hypothetical protein
MAKESFSWLPNTYTQNDAAFEAQFARKVGGTVFRN